MQNPFLRDFNWYQRDIDPIKNYIHQAAVYLNLTQGVAYDQAAQWVTTYIKTNPDKTIEMPIISYSDRDEHEDRVEKQGYLYQYIMDSIKDREFIAPTLTTYLHPEVKASIPGESIVYNMAQRSVIKKQEQAAQAEKKVDDASYFANEQNTIKRYNNAYSGMMTTQGSIFYNKSAHSALTSMCRITSANGNANNERILAGHRHYHDTETALNHVISTVAMTDLVAFEAMMKRYQLYEPTVDEAYAVLAKNYRRYHLDERPILIAKTWLAQMTGVQRAAYVYTGDLFHFRQYNEPMMRQIIHRLSTPQLNSPIHSDDLQILNSLNEDYVALLQLIFSEQTAGKGKKFQTYPPQLVSDMVATYHQLQACLNDVHDWLQCLLCSKNIPASIGYLPTMIREAVPGSDTDSTLFTVDNWVTWYFGIDPSRPFQVTPEIIGVAAVMIFVTSQSIRHILAILSVNMGVIDSRRDMIDMKNEFLFLGFGVTHNTKHYFAQILSREGSVFDHLELEIKGVHLKNSNVPKPCIDMTESLIQTTLERFSQGEQLSLQELLDQIVAFETMIKTSLLQGETTFYKLQMVKDPSSYKNEEDNARYRHIVLWKEVFSQKYGEASLTPIQCVDVPLTLTNKTAIKTWLAQMEDTVIRDKLSQFFQKTNRTSYETCYVPLDNLLAYGLPHELKPVVNIHKIILILCKSIYQYLETLGIYLRDHQILSDLIPNAAA